MQQESDHDGFAWLEVLLAFAIIGLLAQLFPSHFGIFLRFFDIRNLSHVTWFEMNALGVAVLIGIRQRNSVRYLLRLSQQLASQAFSRSLKSDRLSSEEIDLEERKKRDAEWAERAKNRRPYT